MRMIPPHLNKSGFDPERALVDLHDGAIVLIDKPIDWTSFDVVHRIRAIANVKKVGHAGTLDPKATGLLVVCTGRNTKLIDQFTGLEKEYEGIMEVGAVTPSFDCETEISARKDFSAMTDNSIQSISQSLCGFQLQIPPMYSALKYAGKPLYSYARKGRTVVREPREIVVSFFKIEAAELPFIRFSISCSKGTYIRSLVDEFGQRAGCGAYLKELRRTKIGEYHVDQALTIDNIMSLPRFSIRHAG